MRIWQFPDGHHETFAIVCKIQMYPKSDYNFGYKDMDESMGPFYYDCPNDILDLLTETKYESALVWREECRRRNAASAAVKLSKGCYIRFENPIGFSNGFSAQVFVVENAVSGYVRGLKSDGEFSAFVKITKLRDRCINGEASVIKNEIKLFKPQN